MLTKHFLCASHSSGTGYKTCRSPYLSWSLNLFMGVQKSVNQTTEWSNKEYQKIRRKLSATRECKATCRGSAVKNGLGGELKLAAHRECSGTQFRSRVSEKSRVDELTQSRDVRRQESNRPHDTCTLLALITALLCVQASHKSPDAARWWRWLWGVCVVILLQALPQGWRAAVLCLHFKPLFYFYIFRYLHFCFSNYMYLLGLFFPLRFLWGACLSSALLFIFLSYFSLSSLLCFYLS